MAVAVPWNTASALALAPPRDSGDSGDHSSALVHAKVRMPGMELDKVRDTRVR